MLRLRRPTPRTVHILWLIVSAGVALFVTRGAVLAVFLGLFFVVWLVGYWILFRGYK
jgi:hypothetical protein